MNIDNVLAAAELVRGVPDPDNEQAAAELLRGQDKVANYKIQQQQKQIALLEQIVLQMAKTIAMAMEARTIETEA